MNNIYEWPLYAIAVDNGNGERLVFLSSQPDSEGRRFWYGGSSMTALIFPSSQSAHAFAKREKVLDDFGDEAQLYVRKVELLVS